MSDPARRERWQQIERIYWRAVEKEGEARTELLDETCGSDHALRQSVESLLNSGDEVSGFLEGSALDVAADLIAEDEHLDLTGRRFGPYTIRSWIGAGAMGDVYRASDERLQRDVALKVLPHLVADDEGRSARLEREAQVLASLNHQNIAAIYGLEEGDGIQALVLELVNGPTLLEVTAQKRLGVDEALSIARQIAEGLEAAHGRGVVHRDLKPSNIAVRADGVVKLLDFGIAAVLMAGVDLEAAGQAGAIGTPAYASPEQLRGRSTDKRSDIWSFGAVLYELLSGRPAFIGETTADTIDAVLKGEVDYAALPSQTPSSIRHLVARCLTNDPRQRLQDIGEARIALDAANLKQATGAKATVPDTPRSRLRPVISIVVAAMLISALTASVTWYLKPPRAGGVARLTVLLPEGQVLSLANGQRPIAISPDGTQIVYAGVPAALYHRELTQSEPTAIKGSDGLGRVSEPTFSPDGKSIAFHANGAIRTIPLAGGTPTVVVTADAPTGMSWDEQGIVFGQGAAGIMRAQPTGGTASTLVRIDHGEEARAPQFLPDGRHVLFTLASGTSADRWEKARIVAQSLVSGERVSIIDGGTDARYLPTGHVIYARKGTLYAVAFDLKRLTIDGTPRPILEGVAQADASQSGTIQATVSDSGVLIYLPASAAAGAGQGEVFRLGLIDRHGTITPLPLAPDTYRTPRVSPDGAQISFGTETAGEAVIWISDIAGKTPRRRLTFGGNNRIPIWSPDGARVAFQSDRDGDRGIFVQPANGSEAATRLTQSAPGVANVPQSWSPDGRTLLFTAAERAGTTLWMLSLNDRKSTTFADVHAPSNISASFSPDGKWIAYSTGNQNRLRIYMQPVPPSGAVYQLDSGAATPTHPVWSRDGKEVFFNPGLKGLGVVPIHLTPAVEFGTPAILPRTFRLSPPEQPVAYDVTPNDRFLARIPVDDSLDATRAGTRIQIVLNWFEEVRRRSVPGL